MEHRKRKLNEREREREALHKKCEVVRLSHLHIVNGNTALVFYGI